jgi:hypothetical protein
MAEVNTYLEQISLKTNDPGIQLLRVKNGVETLTMVSAKDVPGVLLQVTNTF